MFIASRAKLLFLLLALLSELSGFVCRFQQRRCGLREFAWAGGSQATAEVRDIISVCAMGQNVGQTTVRAVGAGVLRGL